MDQALCEEVRRECAKRLIADTLIMADRILKGKLLRMDLADDIAAEFKALSKEVLALAEARRIKKLIGHLRYLFRNSDQSTRPEIAELKGYLKKKPPSPKKLEQVATDIEMEKEQVADGIEPEGLHAEDLEGFDGKEGLHAENMQGLESKEGSDAEDDGMEGSDAKDVEGSDGKQILTHGLLLKRFQLPDEGRRDRKPDGERPNGAEHRSSQGLFL